MTRCQVKCPKCDTVCIKLDKVFRARVKALEDRLMFLRAIENPNNYRIQEAVALEMALSILASMNKKGG